MKKIIKISSLLLIVMGILIGCTVDKDPEDSSAGSDDSSIEDLVASPEELEPYGKYDETLTYTVGKVIPGNPKLPDGDTYEDNDYTEYLKEVLNIQNVNDFEAQSGDNYDQRVSMAIATEDLPDIMVVGLETLHQLVENDLIADLTEVYETSTTDRVKEMYDSYDGRAIDLATFDGKIMALPGTQTNNVPTMLWIRQDWMDKLGLDAPKTVDDLEEILTAFIEENPGDNEPGRTIGLGMSEAIGGLYGALFQADHMLSTFDSFPRQWIEQDGEVIYGSITEGTKEGLAKLADWYDKGLIDPQLAVRDSVESILTNGEAGAFFGPWWASDYPLNDAKKIDPEADWQPYIISDEDGKVKAFTQNPTDGFYVVRKGFEHPELLPKIASVLNDKLVYEDYNYEPIVEFNKQGYDGGKPLDILINYSTATTDMHDDIVATIDGEKDPETLNIDDYAQYQKVKAYLDDPENADENAWSGYMSRIVSTGLMKDTELEEVHPVFFGQTPTMKLKWTNLVKLEDEAFLKIVTGEEDIDYFDEFVETWKNTGGDEITQEVVEAIKQ